MNTRSTFLFLRIALGLVLLSSLALGEITSASAQGVRCYVKWNASGSNTGASWQNAFNDLQSALGVSDCTEVWVAEGTYKPTGPAGGTDRTASFELKSGVALYGGFAGTETLLTQRNPMTNPTILSGDIGETAVTTDNSYHVVVSSGADTTALLDGFTITAGNASSTVSPDDSGGGMLNTSGSPSLANVTFSANSATYGGGMENYYYSNPSLVNVTFSANSATGGGGMANLYSSPDLVNVTFNGNSATWEGGGMYSTYQYGSGPSLRNVTFSGNSAPSGGAVSNSGRPTAPSRIAWLDCANFSVATGRGSPVLWIATPPISPWRTSSSCA